MLITAITHQLFTCPHKVINQGRNLLYLATKLEHSLKGRSHNPRWIGPKALLPAILVEKAGTRTLPDKNNTLLKPERERMHRLQARALIFHPSYLIIFHSQLHLKVASQIPRPLAGSKEHQEESLYIDNPRQKAHKRKETEEGESQISEIRGQKSRALWQVRKTKTSKSWT